jgi:uncharacterized protein (DUF2235 family)
MLDASNEEVLSSFHFFFFVNTKSGNREGQQIISYRSINFDSLFEKQNKVKLSFVDLFDNDNRIG